MYIRSAEKRDFNRINQLYEQVDQLHWEAHTEIFQEPTQKGRSDDYLLELIDKEGAFLLVAEKSNKIVGFAEAYIIKSPDYPILKKRSWFLIDSIAVDKDSRHMGIGQALYNKLESIAKKRNIKSIELKVYAFNKSAEAFYNKNDFSVRNKTMFKRID